MIAVGDGAIGKTSLFMSYVNRTFDQTYIPTVFDIYNTKVNKLDYYPKYGQSLNVNLTLNDTAGQEGTLINNRHAQNNICIYLLLKKRF